MDWLRNLIRLIRRIFEALFKNAPRTKPNPPLVTWNVPVVIRPEDVPSQDLDEISPTSEIILVLAPDELVPMNDIPLPFRQQTGGEPIINVAQVPDDEIPPDAMCAYDGMQLRGRPTHKCASCGVVMSQEGWEANGGCAQLGCREAPRR